MRCRERASRPSARRLGKSCPAGAGGSIRPGFRCSEGGMDLAQQQELLKNTKIDDSIHWEDLDASLAALRHGHPLLNPASPINDVARALWARTGLDQWDSLQRDSRVRQHKVLYLLHGWRLSKWWLSAIRMHRCRISRRGLQRARGRESGLTNCQWVTCWERIFHLSV